METRTLLTVVALMLAGIVAILLVRTESGDTGNIFSSNYTEASRNALHAKVDARIAQVDDQRRFTW